MSEQLPLLPAVRLRTTFEDLLGRKESEMPATTRRERWEEWKDMCRDEAKRSDDASYVYEVWTDTSGCEGCRHLRGDWCADVGLPAAINPYLSFKHAMPGMACMGMGKSHRSAMFARKMRRGGRRYQRRLNRRARV